jgi:hypothetical protein
MNTNYLALILSLFLSIPLVFAFEGELTYEIQDSSSSKNGVKSHIKLYIINSQIRIDKILSSTNGDEVISAYLNYQLGEGYLVKNKETQKIDLRTLFKSPDFLMPEEMTKTGSSKMLLESKMDEYETFYFINKHRLSLKVWYSPQTFPGNFYPVWQLFQLQPDLIITNYFIHLITHQIAYEMNFTTLEGKSISYKLIKIDKQKPSDSSFIPPK